MNNLIKNLIKKGREVSLSKIEKTEIRQRLLAYMKGTEAMQAVRSAPFSWSRILKPAFVSVLIASLTGGGVSFASENSLPGDLLYPVKVNVNEEVRAALLPTAEAKADWEATRAIRRLEEAEQLAAKGELNDAQQEQIEKKFEEHAEKSEARIAALEAGIGSTTVAAEISSRMEGSLNAHGRILEKLSAKRAKIATVTEKVKIRAKAAMVARVGAEAKLAAADEPVTASAMSFSMKATVPVTAGKPVVKTPPRNDFRAEQKKKRDEDESRILIKAREELKVDVSTSTEVKKEEEGEHANEEHDVPGELLPAVKVRAVDEGALKIGL